MKLDWKVMLSCLVAFTAFYFLKEMVTKTEINDAAEVTTKFLG